MAPAPPTPSIARLVQRALVAYDEATGFWALTPSGSQTVEDAQTLLAMAMGAAYPPLTQAVVATPADQVAALAQGALPTTAVVPAADPTPAADVSPIVDRSTDPGEPAFPGDIKGHGQAGLPTSEP